MISPSPMRRRRFLLFALAVTAIGVSFTFAEPGLTGIGLWLRDLRGVIFIRGIMEAVAILLLALPLGVLIDRVRRRPVMVLTPLLGTAAVASVAAADGLGVLSGPHLIAVMTVTGTLAMAAQLGQDAYLPSVVGRARLLPANALLSVLPQIFLVGVIALPSSLAGHEIWFLVVISVVMAGGALLFRGVDAVEPPPPPRVGLRREVAEGIRFTVKHPVVRAIAIYLVLSALFAELSDEVTTEARKMMIDAGVGYTSVGGFLLWSTMTSAYGAPILGALLAVLLHRRLGTFRLAWSAMLVSQPFMLLLALSGTAWGHIWYVIGTAVAWAGATVAAIALLSHRQAITPDRLLGRVGGVLVVLTSLAGAVGELLEEPAERLAELGGSTPTALTLLPGLALATVAALAAAIPLLRTRRLALDHFEQDHFEADQGDATSSPSLTVPRGIRRGMECLVTLALLTALPAADLASGDITSPDQCAPRYDDGSRVRTGDRVFVCAARAGGRFANVSDRDLLTYGRAMCEAYPGRGADKWFLVPICPKAAAEAQAEIDAEEAEYQAREAANQKVCDRFRHRPLARPVRVIRERMSTDYGVMEAFEYDESRPTDPYEDGLLEKAQDNGLVATLPGHLMILSHSDYDICVTAETYRRRPPVEVKGWHHVVEVGYKSLTGDIELMDPMVGEGLPNLAFRGKGHYRIRVHYRKPDWEAWTPQHLLIVVFPAKGDQVVEHRPSR
ncbi:MFS transporter [Sphaerimonospora thailandensis]|uniref:MFS transporter n=1 Tax=Sphaerimonospora thailandensis TaxID=795644 RepID=A0A8J3VY59_9ACTN|nr:MFS transporter [Sphaerimonospora thailandensis]GIH68658.1 hypothetical protein Mth01_09110 [Sphaerimonospora thailandensis]